jgi:hypothetical protein
MHNVHHGCGLHGNIGAGRPGKPTAATFLPLLNGGLRTEFLHSNEPYRVQARR